MKSVFGRYLALCVAGISIEIILLVIILVDSFKYSSNLAQSLYNFIGNSPIALDIFNFLADWAAAISIFAIFLVAVPFFLNFQKYRRYRALKKLHDWAKNAILVISDYRKRDVGLQYSSLERYEVVTIMINALKKHHHAALACSKIIGGDLDANTRKLVNALVTIEEKVKKHDDSAFEDLKSLHHDIANIMIYAFESAQDKKQKAN